MFVEVCEKDQNVWSVKVSKVSCQKCHLLSRQGTQSFQQDKSQGSTLSARFHRPTEARTGLARSSAGHGI